MVCVAGLGCAPPRSPVAPVVDLRLGLVAAVSCGTTARPAADRETCLLVDVLQDRAIADPTVLGAGYEVSCRVGRGSHMAAVPVSALAMTGVGARALATVRLGHLPAGLSQVRCGVRADPRVPEPAENNQLHAEIEVIGSSRAWRFDLALTSIGELALVPWKGSEAPLPDQLTLRAVVTNTGREAVPSMLVTCAVSEPMMRVPLFLQGGGHGDEHNWTPPGAAVELTATLPWERGRPLPASAGMLAACHVTSGEGWALPDAVPENDRLERTLVR